MPFKPSDTNTLNAPIDSVASGRSLPHSLDAEKGLLAACLIDPAEVISRCMAQKLPGEAFYSPAHQLIYKTGVDVFEQKSMLDAKILVEELNTRGELEEIGGPTYVAELATQIETTAHATYFLDIVREKYLLRRLIHTATKTVKRCFEPQVDGFTQTSQPPITAFSTAVSDSEL